MLDIGDQMGLAGTGLGDGRRLVRWMTALACVVLGGTVGLAIIEGWDLWRSFFFTLITITTVGYGDEGISDAGRKFAALLLIVGIGVASYTFALIVQSAVTAELAWRKRMQKRIDQLRNHTIVCGFGRMGKTVCEQLAAAHEPFVMIEQNERVLNNAREFGYLTVEGSASEDDVLNRAGIKRAKYLISVVDSEADNIVITLSARELNQDLHILARAEREEEVRKLRRAGASRVVAPFQSGGVEIANAVLRPHMAGFHQLSFSAESQLSLAEVLVEEGSCLVERTLADYGRQECPHLAVVALIRPGQELQVHPGGTEILQAKDILVVAGDPDDIARMRDLGCRVMEPETV